MTDQRSAAHVLSHEDFAKELTRFAQACSRGDAGQALASRSALLLHDKALHVEAETFKQAWLAEDEPDV